MKHPFRSPQPPTGPKWHIQTSIIDGVFCAECFHGGRWYWVSGPVEDGVWLESILLQRMILLFGGE